MAYNHEWPYTDPYRSNADWLINKVKEFGETLDSWKSTIDQLVAALAEINEFDDRITSLENATADLPEIRAKLTQLQASLEDAFSDIAALDSKIDNITIDYDLVLAELARIVGLFPTYLKEANDYTDIKVSQSFIEIYQYIAELQRQIDELKQLRPITLVNPIRGTENGLQSSYNLAYADMRDDCLTVAQFSELGLTSNEFDAYELNNIEFSLHSRSIFKWDYVTAPVTGLYKSISHALSELLNFILGSFTVTEFAALDLTSDDFDALDYSCLDFLMANDANRGLTVTEFSDIIKSGGSGILRTE